MEFWAWYNPYALGNDASTFDYILRGWAIYLLYQLEYVISPVAQLSTPYNMYSNPNDAYVMATPLFDFAIQELAAIAAYHRTIELMLSDPGLNYFLYSAGYTCRWTRPGNIPRPEAGEYGAWTTSNEDNEEDVYYTVSLAANPEWSGWTSGEGRYKSGSSVIISAFANSGYKFFGWTGSASFSQDSYGVMIDCDKSFTANFRPCFDEGRANPFPHMALAPPNSSNVAGATFGNTRKKANGTVKFHNGIDLVGAVGTPVYAQFDGTIAGPLVTEQPNRVNGNYPDGYSGDTDPAGNRIYVDSSIGNSTGSITVRNGYWHLHADIPVATNPRTGLPFATGDVIYAGEVIGYVGVTGNSNPNLPHLHLTTKVNGGNADPATFLNATISTTTTIITTPCD